MTLGAMHSYVSHQGDAWQLMLDQASRFFDSVAAQSPESPDAPAMALPQSPSTSDEIDERWEHVVSPFLNSARALAEFTARLHLTLGSASSTSPLAAIPATPADQRSFYQTLRNVAGRLQLQLGEPDPAWSAPVRELALQVKSQHSAILNRIRSALDPQLAGGRRIRCHGDYHLGQLLVSGQDFILSDFEGAADRPIGERRIKRSPLHDVATLLRSLDYVAGSVRLELIGKRGSKQGVVRHEDRDKLQPYEAAWRSRLEREFFTTYTTALESSDLLPFTAAARQELLELMRLERAFREAEHDLLDRPEWAVIPLSAILRSLEQRPA